MCFTPSGMTVLELPNETSRMEPGKHPVNSSWKEAHRLLKTLLSPTKEALGTSAKGLEDTRLPFPNNYIWDFSSILQKMLAMGSSYVLHIKIFPAVACMYQSQQDSTTQLG
jgi:hypothetical protein